MFTIIFGVIGLIAMLSAWAVHIIDSSRKPTVASRKRKAIASGTVDSSLIVKKPEPKTWGEALLYHISPSIPSAHQVINEHFRFVNTQVPEFLGKAYNSGLGSIIRAHSYPVWTEKETNENIPDFKRFDLYELADKLTTLFNQTIEMGYFEEDLAEYNRVSENLSTMTSGNKTHSRTIAGYNKQMKELENRMKERVPSDFTLLVEQLDEYANKIKKIDHSWTKQKQDIEKQKKDMVHQQKVDAQKNYEYTSVAGILDELKNENNVIDYTAEVFGNETKDSEISEF